MNGTSDIAGVILSGGRSSRMGGGDKSLLAIEGKSLLSRAIERLQPQVGRLAINANGDAARFAAFGLPVIADTTPDYAGPLAGILAALEWASGAGCAAVVTVAGDTPFFPRDLVSRLVAAKDGRDGHIAVACVAGRRHPVFALWPIALRASLSDHLAKPNVGRVNAFIDLHPHVDVDFEDLSEDGSDPFFNINTPDDLAKAAAFLREQVR